MPPPLNIHRQVGTTDVVAYLLVAVLPWLFTMLVFLVMVTYIPEISLWLPRVLGMI